MAEPTYALLWPRELFDAEAKWILDSEDDSQYGMISLLLEEAFEDEGVAEACRAKGPSYFYGPTTEAIPNEDSAEKWFKELLQDESRLVPYKAPKYWAQRNDTVPSSSPEQFAAKFMEIVVDLADNGYFPKVLPTFCFDEDGPTDEQISKQVTKAIGIPFKWDELQSFSRNASDDLIYSLIEYFHDQAQRPRSCWEHNEFVRSHWHFTHHDASAGQAVYRWKLNQLLSDHGLTLRLANQGEERGRLVREFSPPFQGLVESQLTARDEPGDEIAHAIRDFRSRDASLVAKRAAITLIANNLEARRQVLKVELKQDESDLFNIANNFQLRHRNVGQKSDYGHEFADWIFWNFLAAVELLDALELRGSEE